MRGVRRLIVVAPCGVLAVVVALTACDLALGLGDLQVVRPDSTAQAIDDGSALPYGDPEAGDVGWPAATSCEGLTGPGRDDCGPARNESCCATSVVTGGAYARGNVATYPATISNFRLDRFEVSVGRLRPFIDAVVVGGWRPGAGSGKHAHLNGGRGLELINGGYELGWNAAWNDLLPTTRERWTETLSCDSNRTWTDAPDAGEGEARPVNCLSWYEAYAFCIWDGGFLPSDAEWGYAASGGEEQRTYPWSSPPASSAVDCSYANVAGCFDAGTRSGGATSPKGDARWGQADLGGNVYEWNLDSYSSSYANPCVDCTDTSDTTNRVDRGGSFKSQHDELLLSHRRSGLATWHYESVGVRCARPQ